MAPPLGGGSARVPALALAAAAAVGFASALALLWTTGQPINRVDIGLQSHGCQDTAKKTPVKPGGIPGASHGIRTRAPPGPNGYLIIGEFDFYRFTNNKIQLIEALAMAVSFVEFERLQHFPSIRLLSYCRSKLGAPWLPPASLNARSSRYRCSLTWTCCRRT